MFYTWFLVFGAVFHVHFPYKQTSVTLITKFIDAKSNPVTSLRLK